MLFGKHINRYYLRYSAVLLLGLLALIVVDYAQLTIPELYKMVMNGEIPDAKPQIAILKTKEILKSR